MDLGFLSGVTLSEAPAKKASAPQVALNPEDGYRLRIFTNGAIYPSKALVEAFALEYVNKGVEVNAKNQTPCGFDFINSKDWVQYPAGVNAALFVALVPKTAPKVDIFSSCTYEEDGSPKIGVMEQGSKSFGKVMLEAIADVYGVEPEGRFIDMEINVGINMPAPNGLFLLPKKVTRGEKKGQVTYTRRENVAVNPLVPVSGTYVEIVKEAPVETTPEANTVGVAGPGVVETTTKVPVEPAMEQQAVETSQEATAPIIQPIAEQPVVAPEPAVAPAPGTDVPQLPTIL